MTLKRNRRKQARYGMGSLRVGLHRIGLLGLFTDLLDVRPVDFNTYGLAFRCTRMLSPGQPVVMDLETGEHRVVQVAGVVRDTTRMTNHFRCGVEFDFAANEHMRSEVVKDTIRQMEKSIKEVVILAAK